MKYAGNIAIYNSDGNCIHKRDLSPDEIIEELLRCYQSLPATIEQVTLSPKNIEIGIKKIKKLKNQKPTRTTTCTKCGEKGHTQKTCKKTIAAIVKAPDEGKKPDFDTLDKVPPVPMLNREENEAKYSQILKLFKHGCTVDEVAIETQMKPEVLKFMRRGMISRNELGSNTV